MTPPDISNALTSLQDAIESLEDGYWEASDIRHKDQLFNLAMVLQREYHELLKVSVQDHHFPYEVMNLAPEQLTLLINDVLMELDTICQRVSTRERLGNHCQQLLNVVGPV